MAKNPNKSRIQLVVWDSDEAKIRAGTLKVSGYDVSTQLPGGPATLRKLSETLPTAVVIDLSRRPSSGRDIGLAIRSFKALRHVPLVFVEGEREKVASIRKLLPDATYTTWSRVRGALKRAIASPPSEPTVPKSVFAGYADAKLPKKLGIQPGTVVAMVGAPKEFEKTLGNLPKDAVLRPNGRGHADLTLWFTRSRKELEDRIDRMVRHAQSGGLWILWPKKTSPLAADLSQPIVRQTGLAAGLVDYKVCSVDETWTGLKFTLRKPKQVKSRHV
jgi:hypothetical protein